MPGTWSKPRNPYPEAVPGSRARGRNVRYLSAVQRWRVMVYPRRSRNIVIMRGFRTRSEAMRRRVPGTPLPVLTDVILRG